MKEAVQCFIFPARSKRRNKKKKRTGTVACAQYFPAIIEREAEEQKEMLEISLQPDSPLTPLYCTISRKAPVMWPAFLGDWAYSEDETLHRGKWKYHSLYIISHSLNITSNSLYIIPHSMYIISHSLRIVSHSLYIALIPFTLPHSLYVTPIRLHHTPFSLHRPIPWTSPHSAYIIPFPVRHTIPFMSRPFFYITTILFTLHPTLSHHKQLTSL